MKITMSSKFPIVKDILIIRMQDLLKKLTQITEFIQDLLKNLVQFQDSNP